MWLSIVKYKRSQCRWETEGGCAVSGLGQPCVLTWSMTAEKDTSKGGKTDHDQNERERSARSVSLTVVYAQFSLICQLSYFLSILWLCISPRTLCAPAVRRVGVNYEVFIVPSPRAAIAEYVAPERLNRPFSVWCEDRWQVIRRPPALNVLFCCILCASDSAKDCSNKIKYSINLFLGQK